MRKTLLTILTLVSSGLLWAQSSAPTQARYTPTPAMKNRSVKSVKAAELNENKPLQVAKNPGAVTMKAPAAPSETVIGTTTYDLQTNASIARRLVKTSSGGFAAGWTWSKQLNSTWSDRGTGYTCNNGTTWGIAPTNRTENERTGWPNIGVFSSGKPISIAHGTASNKLIKTSKNAFCAAGSWTTTQLNDVLPAELWPRAAVGGTNGETVHLIGITAPAAFDGVPYKGMDGALLYSRSTDGGLNWDIASYQLPGSDSADYTGIGGDVYSVDVNGDNVAIAVAELGSDINLWTSQDAGVTWEKHVVLSTGYGRFDETQTLILDTVETGDGAISVVIDDNGVSHVFFGIIGFQNDDVTDASSGVFLTWTSQLGYWNTSMDETEYMEIAGTFDTDGDGQFLYNDAAYDFFRYANTNSYISMPSAGVSNDGCVYVIYTNSTEYNNGTNFYRHTYAISSCDGGCTWTFPTPVTGGSYDELVDLDNDAATTTDQISLNLDHDFEECTYAGMARTVDDNLYFTFQRDFNPGHALDNDAPTPVDFSDIVFSSVSRDEMYNWDYSCYARIIGERNICTGENLTLRASCGSAYLWSTGEQTEEITINTKGEFRVTITTYCGEDMVDSVMIDGPDGFTATSTSSDSYCSDMDGSASVTAVGNATPFVYEWSNGAMTESVSNLAGGEYMVTVTDRDGCTNVETVTVSVFNDLAAAVSSQNSACLASDGDATVAATGSYTPFTYEWTNGSDVETATALAAGTYFVTVTDNNGCTEVAEFDIVNNGAPSLTVTSNPVSCFGDTDGDASVEASAGTTDFTYSWPSVSQSSTTATGLGEGAYKVNVTETATGCIAIAEVIVAEPALLEGTTSVTAEPTCFGSTDGAAMVVATGGNGGFTYEWDDASTADAISGVVAGTYDVTITDVNNCVAVASVEISDPAMLVATASNSNILCYGGSTASALASATGGTGSYDFVWSNGSSTISITSVAAGVYTLTVTDGNGCTSTKVISVTEPDVLSVTPVVDYLVEAGTGYNYANISTTVSGGVTPYTYDWTGPSSFVSDLQDLTNLYVPGNYLVTLTDDNSCTSVVSSTVAGSVDTKEVMPDLTVSVYPNPNNGSFVVEFGNGVKGTHQIIVTNVVGQVTYVTTVNASDKNNTAIDLTSSGSGIYFVNVKGNGMNTTQRVVVK